MSVETVLAIIASSFGVVMGASPGLQIRKMITQRSSRDVSIGYFAIIAIGSVLWASYSVSLGNLAILIPNAVAFLAAVATILVARRLRRPDGLPVSGLARDHELVPPPGLARWQIRRGKAEHGATHLTAGQRGGSPARGRR